MQEDLIQKVSEFEISKKKELEKLFFEWRKVITSDKKTVKNGDRGKKLPQDCFVEDGFFPGYFSKENKYKILFIGRESRYIRKNYVEQTLADKGYSSNWWRRILYLTYGIQHEGKVIWSKLPDYQSIIAEMEANNNYGFAVMNISKYSNHSLYGAKSNYNLINQFLDDSDCDLQKLFNRELSILEPDIIITTDLWNGKIKRINELFDDDKFDFWNVYGNNKAAYGRYNKLNCMVIDVYHFATPFISDRDLFYNPVMQILFHK